MRWPADVAFAVVAVALTLLHFPLANLELRWWMWLLVGAAGLAFLALARHRGEERWPIYIGRYPGWTFGIFFVLLAVLVGAVALDFRLPRSRVLVLILWAVVMTTFSLLFYSQRDKDDFWSQAANALLTGLILALAAFIVNTALSAATRERQERATRLAINQEEQTVFRRQDLREFDLSGMLMEPDFDFSYADLTGADFTDADMKGVSMRNTILTGAVLELAHMSSANLDAAVLDDVKLLGADLEEASLTGVRLHNATVEPSARTDDDRNAWLATGPRADAARDSAMPTTTVTLRSAQLDGADLSGANLTNADLTGANLTGAILDRTILRGADLNGAVVDANLGDARLDEHTICPSGDHADADTGCAGRESPEGPAVDDLELVASEGANATVLGTVAVSHPSEDATLTFTRVGDAPFDVDPETGAVTASGEEYAQDTYDFVVRVTDGAGATDDGTVTVLVNRAPVFGSSTYRFETGEFTREGSPLGPVTAGDADGPAPLTYGLLTSDPNLPFAVDPATGELSVQAPVASGASPYEFKVEAVDAANPPGRASVVVVVEVSQFVHVVEEGESAFEDLAERFYGDAELAGLIRDANPGVDEPLAVGEELKIPALPEDDDGRPPEFAEPNPVFSVSSNAPRGTVVGRLVATDPDGGQVRYVRAQTDAPFAVDSTTGEVTTTRRPSGQEYTFEVTATDDGMPPQTTATSVTVVRNEVPVVMLPTEPVAVLHTVAPGSVVATVEARDPDGAAVTFGLEPGSPFTIEPASGRITVAGDLRPDESPYELTVTVADQAPFPARTEVTIEIEVLHEVQPGDSLSGIADEYYGDGGVFACIQQANGLTAGGISTGQALTVPPVENCATG